MTAIVELKNVNQSREQWDERRKVILDDVSLEIREHDFITILGAMELESQPSLYHCCGRFR